MKVQFSTPLHTDLYQLMMANAYFHSGIAEREATFNLYYRRPPEGEKFIIFAGLAQALEWLSSLQFEADELKYILQRIPNLHLDFVKALGCIQEHIALLTIRALDEGTIVYPNTPLVTVTGPQWIGQLIETAFLNEINHQSLIATVSKRICSAAAGDPVFEFGFRRAQGASAALNGARAAYIGGAAGTSNVLAGKLYGIPTIGTHAHSWIMSFPSEYDAFIAYARVYPKDCVFLVDTYDTIEGVKTAIRVSKELAIQPKGVRLDSGDLCELSKAVRHLLDDAGFVQTTIIASNDLDAESIIKLKAAGAMITAWGVGTRLITAYHDPALGGVYKLASFLENGRRVNVSKNVPGKTSLCGQLSFMRCFDVHGAPAFDYICAFDAKPLLCDESLVDMRQMLHVVSVNNSTVYNDISTHAARLHVEHNWHKHDELTKYNVFIDHNVKGVCNVSVGC